MKLQRCKLVLFGYILLLSPLRTGAETLTYDLGSPNNNVRAATNSNPVNLQSNTLIGGAPIGTGASVRSGSGAPSNGLGNNGDFYINTAVSPPTLYGPKAAGVWPAPITLGAAGPAGQGVPTGGTIGQILKKASGADYDTTWFTAAGTGTVTNIATTGPITGGPITTTGTIAITKADTTHDGYLAQADWNLFNTKLGANGNGSSLTGILFSQIGQRLTDTQVDQGSVNPPYTTLTDSATITWTANQNLSNQNATVTLGGNRILAFASIFNGATGNLIVKQDATGSRTLTLPAGSKVVNGGGGVITLSTTANAVDIISFTYDGTNYYWTYGKNFN